VPPCRILTVSSNVNQAMNNTNAVRDKNTSVSESGSECSFSVARRFAADLRQIARVVSSFVPSIVSSRQIELWDCVNGVLLQAVRAEAGPVSGVGATVAIGAGAAVVTYDMEIGEPVHRFEEAADAGDGDRVLAVGLCARTMRLASWSKGGVLTLLDTGSRAFACVNDAERCPVKDNCAFAVSAGSARMATAAGRGKADLLLIATDTFAVVRSKAAANTVAVIAAAPVAEEAKGKGGKSAKEAAAPKPTALTAVAISASGTTVASASAEDVRAWSTADASTGGGAGGKANDMTQLATLVGNTANSLALQVSDSHAAVAWKESAGGGVTVFALEDGSRVKHLQCGGAEVRSI
jgi:hypothetical protein